MHKQTPVVDVHYHFVPFVREELIDTYAEVLKMSLRREVPDRETLRRMVRETVIDPNGDLVLARGEKLGVDVTCINFNDVLSRGLSAEQVLQLNKITAGVAQKNYLKIFAFGGIDPRRPEAVEMAKTCLEEYGMIGIKWHPDLGFDPTNPKAYEVLKVLDKLGKILLIHTGYLPGGRCKYTSMSLICDILVDFPNIKVIAAHMGKTFWQEWAGLAHDFPNLYGDLAVWSQYGDRNYDFFCRQLRELTFYAGVEKVLWGSDDPFENYSVPTAQFIRMLRDLPGKAPKGYEFSHEEVDLMLGGNAVHLLKLA